MGEEPRVRVFQDALRWKMLCKYVMFATAGGSSSQSEVLHRCWEIELVEILRRGSKRDPVDPLTPSSESENLAHRLELPSSYS